MTLTEPEIRYLIRHLGGPIDRTTLTGKDALALRAKLEQALEEVG